MQANDFREKIEKALAGKSHIFRNDPARKAIDGLSSGVMANFDCKGTGPKNGFYIGRKRAYPVDTYVEFVVGLFSDEKSAAV